VLGALAIISAILIVLADRDRRNSTPIEQTVTDTVEPVSPEGAPPMAPSAWTGDGPVRIIGAALPGGSPR
jgi:hypothetical protein